MTSTPLRHLTNGYHPRPNGINGSTRRGISMTRDVTFGSNLGVPSASEVGEESREEEDPIHAALKARWVAQQDSITGLFAHQNQGRRNLKRRATHEDPTSDWAPLEAAKTVVPPRKAARTIDEDDYGDDDDEDDVESAKDSPLKSKGKDPLSNGHPAPAVRSPVPSAIPSGLRSAPTATSEPAKSSEDVRKQLEEDKKAAADAAKRTFQSMFFTFENDRDAMLEQQKLDELDREVENEMSGGANGTSSAQQGTSGFATAGSTKGTLGSSDLGASSLTLKHLIARIDQKRDMVKASDNQLRTLMSEVRKGRSKWASEDKVGQEELYEAAEKVLFELKAMTEYAQPFLARVNKRDAPDYHNVIVKPMDLGSMLKKLKQTQYKSKKDFVDDINLIWKNCLRYNQDPAHPLRKKALYMQRETDKLTPLIPEIVVRDRADVEAEERRQNAMDNEDSDEDDAPIMASRGRKAPKKGGKTGPTSTKRPPTVAVDESSSTPAPDAKPVLHPLASNLRNEFLRAESEAHDAVSTGFGTPPPGNATPIGPLGVNGISGSGAPGSQADITEIDGAGASNLSSSGDVDEDDTEFKAWKQVTKKDRAQAAAERHRLFAGDKFQKNLNADEPALLRSKASMRRWMRQQKMAPSEKPRPESDMLDGPDDVEQTAQGETLAEGIEKDEDSTLPDYYTSLSAIPEIYEQWRWTTDSEGYAVSQTDDWMRMYPHDQFKSVEGAFNKKLEANMRQMQETRKVCAKINIVKQMQIQAQTYQNQFSKYEPQPFVEQDVGPTVVSEAGPVMAPTVCRAALKRSIGKVFYHAGFEDFQPSAMETVTDLASDYFAKLADCFKKYREPEKDDNDRPRFTFEEQVLHTLHEHGLDLDSLEMYVKDDVDRQSTKLGVVHDRMKSHLAELLRPALGDNAGTDGVGAFNDGSEQFVGGDFAEDLDEDFFGFRELGLADEFGLESLSVPLHLLQNRVHSAYQSQNQEISTTVGLSFPPPPPYDPITISNLPNQVGIVQDFFREKLRKNHDEPLVEDEDLPQKQRFPKPRLPPTGKISSPRKRPLREQQQAAKKKRKLEENEANANKDMQPPVGKLKLTMPENNNAVGNDGDPEKDGDANGTAMISPESINGD